MKKRSWTKDQLVNAVASSRSIRQVIMILGLIPAGGNYSQIRYYISYYELNIDHFKGKGWSKDEKRPFTPRQDLDKILVKNSTFQSFKLKNRLLREGLKLPKCEECNWNKKSDDGRIPVELDHINGDGRDNRLDNLRILCPNCHSLKATHRGRNMKKFKKR